MTYGQRRRAEERKLERASAKAQAWYDALSPEERAQFDEKARIAADAWVWSRGYLGREKGGDAALDSTD